MRTNLKKNGILTLIIALLMPISYILYDIYDNPITEGATNIVCIIVAIFVVRFAILLIIDD